MHVLIGDLKKGEFKSWDNPKQYIYIYICGGSGTLEKNPHLVIWSMVCMPKKLSIRNLSILNIALLGQWSWRFFIEREPLWKWIIIRKFREEGKDQSSSVLREVLV